MFIYKITNKIDGKHYIGMTSRPIKDRWSEHCSIKNSGTAILSSAVRKYGKENFIVEEIDSATSLDELRRKEIAWISALNSIRPNGYNVQQGGIGGRNENAILAHEIAIRCLSTGEHFKSITEAAKTYNLNISKVALVCKGKRDSTEGYSFEYIDANKAELAIKLKENRTNKVKQKHRRSVSGKIGAKKRFKKIKCIETNVIFESIAEAARMLGIHRSNIIKHLQGKHGIVQGYTFVQVL